MRKNELGCEFELLDSGGSSTAFGFFLKGKGTFAGGLTEALDGVGERLGGGGVPESSSSPSSGELVACFLLGRGSNSDALRLNELMTGLART